MNQFNYKDIFNNNHKKTIVETIDDAISVFNSTNLDGLIIDNYFISK